MLRWIIKVSIENRRLVVLFFTLASALGIFLALNMPIDVLPDLNRPTVVLLAEAHELTPERTAMQIALPIERAMSGVPGVERVSSQTGKGMTVIKVEFAWGSDVYRNRQIVQEKLSEVQSAIQEKELSIIMAPISSIMGQIQLIGLTSKTGEMSVEDIRLLAETRLKYDLLAQSGVAKVIVAGGSPKQLQVSADVDKLRAYDVTFDELQRAVEQANELGSGGMIEMGAAAPLVTVSGSLLTADELGEALIKRQGARAIKIKDVAEVFFGPAQIKTGDAGVNGKEGVILVIMKQPGKDTVAISKNLEKAFAQMKGSLPEDLEVNLELFSQRSFIFRALDNLVSALRDGALMVVVILFIFLLNWRTTLITLLTIPVSVALAAIVFAVSDLSINTMTLGGLAVGIGSLVDSAIVDVENCFRRLRQNAAKPESERKKPLEIIADASYEVRGAVIMATVLVVIVYIPLFFLSGMEGRLFVPIGISYIVCMAASLLVAMTLTVSLCALLLPNHLGRDIERDSWLVRTLKRAVGPMIRVSIRARYAVLIVFLVLGGAAVAYLCMAPTQFLPPFNEGVAQINLVLPPETGLKTTSEIGSQAEKLLMKIDGVKNLSRRTGRADEDEHAHGVNASDIIVSFDENVSRSREEILSEVREVLEENFPGVLVAVEQPLAHLISAMLSGVQAQVAIKIYGQDFPRLYEIATQVEAAVKPIAGVVDLKIEQQKLVPLVDVQPKRQELAALGLTVADVTQAVSLAFGEEAVSNLYQGRVSYPIVVRLRPEQRQSLRDIENLCLRNDRGEPIRLCDVADVRLNATINTINHENNERLLSVQFNIAGRALGDVVHDTNQALEPIRQSLQSQEGYRLKISGQYEAQQSASRYMFYLSILSFALMTMVLFLHFKSWNLTFQALCSIPMSLVGAALFVYISGQAVSIATLVGLIAMVGVASSNAILLLDHYLHLMRYENMVMSPELLIRGGLERMTPVLMTALTSGIALLPLLIHPDAPGKEILYPVASVIVGGLISCTLFDFTVRPALFWAMRRFVRGENVGKDVK